MNVVVTGGGTRAPIDDVRAITNTSTGRFSAQITEAFLERGAHVWHIHTPGALRPFSRNAHLDLDAADIDAEYDRVLRLHREYRRHRPRLHLVSLNHGTVSDYASELRRVLMAAPIDLAILAMAVSDYEPDTSTGKLDSSQAEWTLRCHPTPKVIRQVKDWAPDVFLVGFKLLSNVPESTLIETAHRSLLTNRADLVVANDLRTVQADRHTIHLVAPNGRSERFGPGPEMADDLADRLLAAVRRHIAARDPIPLDDDGDAPS
jgi:phosphopantothenate--cysteine ligase